MKDLLDKLQREEKIEIEQFKLEKDRDIEELIETFLEYADVRCLDPYDERTIPTYSKRYYECNLLIKKQYSAKKIEEFTVSLPDLKKNKLKYPPEISLSAYLNYLINNSSDLEFIVHCKDLKISNLGERSSKNITVFGNLGDNTGSLSTGKMMINGNCRGYLGFQLNGGEIIVNGNAGIGVGSYMTEGKIKINGNGGFGVGYEMHGGVIELNENYISLGQRIVDGDIYHKGKLIVKNGKKVQ